jgi:diguanylate cyclase (GGDEF)-like protein
MSKRSFARPQKVRAGAAPAPPHARAPLDERTPRGGEAVPAPARSIPAELAVLLGEIERLQAALKAEQARVRELEATADTDPLTGVFNRRGFTRELKRTLAYIDRYWTRAALLYADLDGFKPVNDTHGHAAGDAILQAVAATLSRNVRASDTVARLGGDEFAVILWNLSEADAVKKARALEAAIAALAVDWNGGALSVGVSIGIAIIDPSDDLAKVTAAADQAMYVRKAARRKILPPAHNLTQ